MSVDVGDRNGGVGGERRTSQVSPSSSLPIQPSLDDRRLMASSPEESPSPASAKWRESVIERCKILREERSEEIIIKHLYSVV